MDFIGAVNRVLRSANIIRGDDDALTDFTGTAHSASQQLAQIAIQQEVSNLAAMDVIPQERTTSTITLSTGTRLYALAADFTRFIDPEPHLVLEDGSGNATGTRLFLWPGGEDNLRLHIPTYREDTGGASWWYWGGLSGGRQQVGFYPLPDADQNGDVYRYYYQASLRVSVTSDNLPFVSEEEAEAFVTACTRRFRYMRATKIEQQQLWPAGIEKDRDHEAALATLMSLLRPKQQPPRYGRRYY